MTKRTYRDMKIESSVFERLERYRDKLLSSTPNGTKLAYGKLIDEMLDEVGAPK